MHEIWSNVKDELCGRAKVCKVEGTIDVKLERGNGRSELLIGRERFPNAINCDI